MAENGVRDLLAGENYTIQCLFFLNLTFTSERYVIKTLAFNIADIILLIKILFQDVRLVFTIFTNI